MSQQINLLNPALIKQKDLLNPINIVLTIGLLLVVMLAYYAYAQKQLSLLTMQRSQVAEQLAVTQTQLKQTALLHTPRAPNKALLDQIAQLEQKEQMQQQVLQIVSLGSVTPEKGYAALMRAFARQTIDNLWLTGFSIDSHTDKLSISGRTTHANLVPEYISRLGAEPALKGKQFSALNMNLTKVDALQPNKPLAAPATPPAATALNKNSKAAPAIQSPAPAQYIEFTLQSVDANPTPAIPISPAKDGGKS